MISILKWLTVTVSIVIFIVVFVGHQLPSLFSDVLNLDSLKLIALLSVILLSLILLPSGIKYTLHEVLPRIGQLGSVAALFFSTAFAPLLVLVFLMIAGIMAPEKIKKLRIIDIWTSYKG